VHGTDNLTTFSKSYSLNLLQPLGPLAGLYRDFFTSAEMFGEFPRLEGRYTSTKSTGYNFYI